MIAFLFPGQGSQQPGMARDFYEGSAPAREVLDETASVLGDNVLDRILRGNEDDLQDTRIAQAALVACGVAIARHLIADGVEPGAAAGHSVGEIAALVTASTLDFGDALRFTRERARLMAEECPDGTMAAVIGLDADRIPSVLPDGAEVANLNGPEQTIISGPAEAIEAAKAPLLKAGAARVLPLKVSGPFHSLQMKPAALKLRKFLKPIAFATPALRFISSVTGRHESDPNTIKELLWKQLYAQVRWTDVMVTLGPVRALEVGPGTVLQGIAKRMEDAPVVSPAGTLEQVGRLAVI